MSVFVISPHAGLLVKGNIDLAARPIVQLPNGQIATVRSVSFGIQLKNGRRAEVLVPSVVGNRVVSDSEAWHQYTNTGRHLGIFDTPAHATTYAKALHEWQARYYTAKLRRKLRAKRALRRRIG